MTFTGMFRRANVSYLASEIFWQLNISQIVAFFLNFILCSSRSLVNLDDHTFYVWIIIGFFTLFLFFFFFIESNIILNNFIIILINLRNLNIMY